MTLLNPATGQYLLNPAPEFIHKEVTEWLSDITFYELELDFFGSLLNKALLRISSSQQADQLKALQTRLHQFRFKELTDIKHQFLRHEHELAELDVELFKLNKASTEETHRFLHHQFAFVTEEVKQFKKQVFNFVETQMRLAKMVVHDFEEGNLSL